MRHGHPASRQSGVGERRSPKTDLCRTGSLQQTASEARWWNTNAGAANERLAYQPHATVNNVAARHGGDDLSQSLPAAAQPTRAASLRQTETRYQPAADGNVIPDAIVRATGPQPSNPSYLSNSGALTHTLDDIRPSVPVSPAAQQIAAEQNKSLRDSFELPAPPTPPGCSMVPSSLSGDRLPSPPMMITPPPDADVLTLTQYLPPPELVTSAASADIANQSAMWHNSDGAHVTSAVFDNNSTSSSLVTSQQADDPPMVRDTRSDLLAAIREGLFLVTFHP